MKIIFAIVFAFVATSYAATNRWGRISSVDKILFTERVRENPASYVLYRSVHFPKYGQSNKVQITAIQATDYASNATASRATLISGGPVFTSASVALKSQPNHGLDYLRKFILRLSQRE